MSTRLSGFTFLQKKLFSCCCCLGAVRYNVSLINAFSRDQISATPVFFRGQNVFTFSEKIYFQNLKDEHVQRDRGSDPNSFYKFYSSILNNNHF